MAVERDELALGNNELAERAANLAGSDDVRETLEDLYPDIEQGFADQRKRADHIKDMWSIYRCELGPKQLFSGRNQLFTPIVYNAVQARSTRYSNQLFPQNGRHIECVSSDGTLPRAAVAVAEHYINYARLRELVPALCIAGDVEGQYNVYVSWREARRYTASRVQTPIMDGLLPVGTVDDIAEEETSLSGPNVEIIPDTDICVQPATAATIDDAIASHGSVAILRRWSKARVKQAMKDGEIDKKAGKELLADMRAMEKESYYDPEKDALNAAGIRKDLKSVYAVVYEIWTELETEDGPRLCQVFMAGADKILMARRNPLWSDKIPLLSVPVKRETSTFKGRSVLTPVADLQYYANDVLNEAADASNYALLPIILRDPENNTAPLVLAPGAIWDVAPANVQFAEFPPLWREGLEIVANIQASIMQTLSVNSAQITMGSYRKQTQAEVAQEQQVDLMTTADAARVLEEGIMTPLIGLIMDMDYQYRDKDLLVRQFGAMGMAAATEMVPPLQNGARYTFYWSGVEASRSAQQTQQKIAALNVIRGLPPQMYPGYTLDAQPVIVDLVENAFGPQMGRLVLKDMRSQLSVDPEKEDQLMADGHYVPIHELDDHAQHIQAHVASIQSEGDPFELKMLHNMEHQQALIQMAAAQAQAMAPQGMPGQPQGQPGAQPGMPGQSPPGAQPAGPTGAQAPPGMIANDELADPGMMPRRAG